MKAIENKTLEELRAKLEKINAEYCKSHKHIPHQLFKAQEDMMEKEDEEDEEDEEEECAVCKEEHDYMYALLQGLARYISYLEQSFYTYASRHSEGHLPPVQGAEKMETALKALGINKDYDVRKPVIYAHENVGFIEIEYKKS